jgi:hypothetical protein
MVSKHPFSRSIADKATGVLLSLVVVAALWGLLLCYTPLGGGVAAGDSLLYTGLLAVGGYYGWYFLQQVDVWQARAGAFVVAQLVCMGAAGALWWLAGWEDVETYTATLPLRAVVGSLCWALLFQWYETQRPTEEELQLTKRELPSTEEELPLTKGELPLTKGELLSSKEELPAYLDRISVKEGTRLHLIPIDELIALQAAGDYVTLITAAGQYVKEQTMKHFETNLSGKTFVRIHRSAIVNVNHILRIEQFGKDTYQVRMTNGTVLRASATGYRLLRDRLGL